MQSINIDRGLSLIEAKLHGKKCLAPLTALAKEHPECINRYLSLAEAIDADLTSRRNVEITPSFVDTTVRISSQREEYSAFFVMPNVSVMVPKGKYTVAFCDKCLYLDSTSKQMRVDYNNMMSVLNVGVLDMKDVMNVVIALKKPLEIGKKKYSCLCLQLDNQKKESMTFEDKKRKVAGKMYSIFLTVLKLNYAFNLIKPESTFFISSQRTAYIKCYYGTSPCWMIPYRCGIVILTSTTAFYFPNEHITAMNLDRLGGGTFDFTVKTSKHTVDLSMVAREERLCLEEYSKEIMKLNRVKENGGTGGMEEDDSSEEEFSAESDDDEDKAEDARALKDLVKENSDDELSAVSSYSDSDSDSSSDSDSDNESNKRSYDSDKTSDDSSDNEGKRVCV